MNHERKLSDTLTVAEADAPEGIVLTRDWPAKIGPPVEIVLTLDEAVALVRWLS